MRIEAPFYALGRKRMAPGLCAWLAAARGGMRFAYAHSVGGRRIYAHGRGVAGVAPEGAGPRRLRLPTFEASTIFVLLGRRPTFGLGRSAALGRSLFR